MPKWFCAFILFLALLWSQPALAATTNTADSIPNLQKGENRSLGTLRIVETKGTAGSIKTGQQVTVKLPEKVEFASAPTRETLDQYVRPTTVDAAYNRLSALEFWAAGEDFLTVRVSAYDNAGEYKGCPVGLEFSLRPVNIDDFTGDIKVAVEAPNTGFTEEEVLVGRVNSKTISAAALDVPSLPSGSSNAKAGRLKISENWVGAVEAAKGIALTAPEEVVFNAVTVLPYRGWKEGEVVLKAIDTDDKGLSRAKLEVKTATSEATGPGAILVDIWYDISDFDGSEIKTKVGSTSVVNAKVGDLGASISAAEIKSIFAGRKETPGNILIKEKAAGSLIENRTITFALPDGITWESVPTAKVTTGDIKVSKGTVSTNKRCVTFIVDAAGTKASEVEFKDAKYDVEPDVAAGKVEVKVGGSAGASGKVVNAEIAGPFIVKADKPAVKAGVQDQPAGDITITEAKEKVFLKDGAQPGKLEIAAPAGVLIVGKPEVAVTAGDLEIEQGNVVLKTSEGLSRIVIPVSKRSTKASTLKISGLKYTVSRVVPEGDLLLSLSGSAMYTVGDHVYRIANAFCATGALAAASPPVNGNGSRADFIVGSDKYSVNDMVYSMDAAPYIKNERTYVPVRYLAYALGITPENVKWESASRTVALQNHVVTVMLGCGCKDIHINGRKKTMDVTAELEKDPLMLPDRWVAEAFGARVLWDSMRRKVILLMEANGGPFI